MKTKQVAIDHAKELIGNLERESILAKYLKR